MIHTCRHISEAAHSKVAIDQQGDITSIWSRSNGTNYEPQTAYRPAGGSWQAPVTLSEAGYDAGGAQIAVDPEGDAAAVWETFPPASSRTIQVSVKSDAGAWSAPVTLADIGEPVGKPRIAIDSHGDAVAVWEEQPINPGPQYIQATIRPAGGTWSVPVYISEGPVGMDPSIAMDAEGNAIVTWLSFGSIRSAVRLASTGTWQAPTNVAAVGLDAGGHPGGPALAVDGEGDAVVAWSSASGNGANHIVYAASLSKGGSLGRHWRSFQKRASTPRPHMLASTPRAMRPWCGAHLKGVAMLWSKRPSSLRVALGNHRRISRRRARWRATNPNPMWPSIGKVTR